MTTQSQALPISGTRLDALLDEVEACLTNQDESSSLNGVADAAELLRSSTLLVDSLGQLGRLFDLW
jgi:hypothetical protein